MDTPIPSGYPPEAQWIQKEIEESLLAHGGDGQRKAKLIESLLRRATSKPAKKAKAAKPFAAKSPKP
ncbi:MAG: hypothetical protein ACKV2Q_34185 [Planctomycetaceae bacterium]